MIWYEDGKETEEVGVPAELVPVPAAPYFPPPLLAVTFTVVYC